MADIAEVKSVTPIEESREVTKVEHTPPKEDLKNPNKNCPFEGSEYVRGTETNKIYYWKKVSDTDFLNGINTRSFNGIYGWDFVVSANKEICVKLEKK